MLETHPKLRVQSRREPKLATAQLSKLAGFDMDAFTKVVTKPKRTIINLTCANEMAQPLPQTGRRVQNNTVKERELKNKRRALATTRLQLAEVSNLGNSIVHHFAKTHSLISRTNQSFSSHNMPTPLCPASPPQHPWTPASLDFFLIATLGWREPTSPQPILNTLTGIFLGGRARDTTSNS